MNYDVYAYSNAKIIVREDYRVYYYMIDPQSHTHQRLISVVQRKVDDYFRERDIPASRKIQRTAQGKRVMWIHFGDISDSHMFYMALAEHITTRGMKFERFTS